MDLQLAGRIAWVTGAGSGIGASIATTLAAEGCDVYVADSNAACAAAVAAECGGRGSPLTLDVGDANASAEAVAQIVSERGRLDIVVNNAGIALTKPASATSDDEWNAVIDTNLSGAFRVARAAAAAMESGGHGGSIVNIASVLARRVARQLPAYIAAKAALVKLTEALALEWAPIGVRVNALAPGYIETDLNREFLASPAGQSIARRVPQRRFGAPADLDGALLLLASDAGRYITGTTIGVDGGHALAWL
jgi:NAD(P)-dependent dehydrogenase (short-subunit alcohol dehydrogenase family)